MEAVLIPIDLTDSSYFTQTCACYGVTFAFRFLWNERDGHLYMDVSTVDGERNGIRMVPNSPLLGNSSVTDIGDFYLLSDEAGADSSDIKYEDYGTVWKLYFVPFEQDEEEE